MIKLLTYFVILVTGLFIVSAPFLSGVFYATVSILQPQYVWFWAFSGISIFKISAGMAIIAWGIMMVRGMIDWRIYNNGIFYAMIVIGVMMHLSNLATPFPNYSSAVSSSLVIDIYTTILIMFFITLGLINDERALKFMIAALVAVTVYYTYWANMNYLTSNWDQFVSGRLEGPRGSPYQDGNVFSILYIIGLPFILFAIYQVDKAWQKALLIMCIPLLWHALILYASRGAILSAGVATIASAWMIKSKAFNVVLLVGVFVFVVDQGGQVLSRVSETVRQSEDGATQVVNPRIISWQVGVQLIAKHPVMGVGPQRFLEASAFYFPGQTPHVAHNTFLNFSANTGLISGIAFLTFFWVARKMYKWNKKTLEEKPNRLFTYINKASFCGLIGYFMGAMFLDLIIFEPFYFLLLIIVANHFLLKKNVSLLPESAIRNTKSSPYTTKANEPRHARV